MPRNALKRADIPLTQEEEDERAKRECFKQSEDILSGLAGKTYGQLTPAEKDQLIQAIALRLGLIGHDQS